MTTTIEAEARHAGEHLAALKTELSFIDQQIDDAADRGDAVAVVQLQKRKRDRERDLPGEITAANADYDAKRLAFFYARKEEERTKVAHQREQVRERRVVQERAIALAVTKIAEGCREWVAMVRRESELEGQLSGRPAAEEIDAIRAPMLQFLDHAVQRLFDLLWIRQRPPIVNLTGPMGEAEQIIHKALFPDA